MDKKWLVLIGVGVLVLAVGLYYYSSSVWFSPRSLQSGGADANGRYPVSCGGSNNADSRTSQVSGRCTVEEYFTGEDGKGKYEDGQPPVPGGYIYLKTWEESCEVNRADKVKECDNLWSSARAAFNDHCGSVAVSKCMAHLLTKINLFYCDDKICRSKGSEGCRLVANIDDPEHNNCKVIDDPVKLPGSPYLKKIGNSCECRAYQPDPSIDAKTHVSVSCSVCGIDIDNK